MKISHICPGSWAANCYLLISGGEAYVIDPCISTDAVVKRAESNGAKIRGVIMTHGHFDHILTAENIGRELGVPTMIHECDAEMLDDGEKNAFKTFFNQERKFAPADKLLKDGDTLTLGDELITVLHTSGHTKGCICLLCTDSFLVTGDTLFSNSFGRIDLYGGDLHQMKASLETLATLDPSLPIYPGHGEPSTLGEALSQIRFLHYFNN